jgi:3-dehydroquinate dehydratase II
MKIRIINGPNLNLLGTREPHIYGHDTLDSIYKKLMEYTPEGYTLTHMQSNHEGVLIDYIHEAMQQKIDWIIINPGAFTHTSIALRDALLASQIPFIEVHLSNIYQRETFRHHSFFSDIAKGVICGFGAHGYGMALQFIMTHTKK